MWNGSNIPWPHELPPHDGLSGVSDRPGHMNSSSTDRLSWVPPSGHMNYQSGLLSEKSGIHCELRTTEVGGPKPVSNARDDKSGIAPLPKTDILLTGKNGSSVLKFDTQAMDTILYDRRFFLDGVDDTHRLELSSSRSRCESLHPGSRHGVLQARGRYHPRYRKRPPLRSGPAQRGRDSLPQVCDAGHDVERHADDRRPVPPAV